MMHFTQKKGLIVGLASLSVLALLLMGAAAAPQQVKQATTVPVVGLPGYDVSVFAKGTKTYYNPDSVEVAGKYVYIGYQNTTAKDGTDNKTSTIVQYTKSGDFVRAISVLGHCDGLRYDPYTNLLWASSNEDGNPQLVTIDFKSGKVTAYQFAKTPHGGGYDDLAFVNGLAFIAASNPTLNSAGVNVFPALDKVTLSNGKANLTPVLYGNATATDALTGQAVSLNLTDPDSISLDTKGNLVLDSQGDAELISLHNLGTNTQTVTRLAVGTQVDDTQWIPTAKGQLVIVDAKANTIYTVTLDKTGFTPGSIYTEAPSDSSVGGFVGKVDPKTGFITPVIIGLVSPTGLGFIPN